MKRTRKPLICAIGIIFSLVFICCDVQRKEIKQEQEEPGRVEKIGQEEVKGENRDIRVNPPEEKNKAGIEKKEEKVVIIENAAKILEQVKAVVEKGKIIERKGGLLINLNDLFKVLKHISLENGYVLDYVYRYRDGGGYPCVYARKKEAASLLSYEEYEKKFSDYQGDEYIINWHLLIKIDGTPESYFEMFTLMEVANNFGLIWHELYRQGNIVPDNESAKRLPEEVQNKIENVDFFPKVIFQGNRVVVSYLVFYNWRGLFKKTAILEIPTTAILDRERFSPIFISGDLKKLVEYSSPICL